MSLTTSAAPPTGLRARKKQATRLRIKEQALALAIERGLDGLTVEAIADAADISPRTFFNYFDCKEAALVSDGGEAVVRLGPLVLERPPAETPLRALREGIRASGLVSADHLDRDRARARQQLVRDHPSLQPRQLAQYADLERMLAEVLAQRLMVDPAQDVRPALLSAITVTMLRVAIQRWTADDGRPLAALVDEQFVLVEAGL